MVVLVVVVIVVAELKLDWKYGSENKHKVAAKEHDKVWELSAFRNL